MIQRSNSGGLRTRPCLAKKRGKRNPKVVVEVACLGYMAVDTASTRQPMPHAGRMRISSCMGKNCLNQNAMTEEAKRKWEEEEESDREMKATIKGFFKHPATRTGMALIGSYILLYALGYILRAAAKTAEGWNELRKAAQDRP